MRLTYCTVSDVDSRAADEKQTSWLGLSGDARTELIFTATDDILSYHGMTSTSGQLWGFQYLREAAESRCMYLARMRSLKDLKERVNFIGAESFNDGILSLSGVNSETLDPVTKNAVDSILKAYGCVGEFSRG